MFEEYYVERIEACTKRNRCLPEIVAKPHLNDSHLEERDLTDLGIFLTLFHAAMYARRTSPLFS
jgi:hypothetical protein